MCRMLIAMNTGMTSQLVRAREALLARREGTGEWLLAGVCPNVASLTIKNK